LTPHGPLPRGRGAALAMGCRARASHVPCNSVWTAPADRVRVLYARGILAHDVPLPARDRGPAGAAACARAVSELPPKAELAAAPGARAACRRLRAGAATLLPCRACGSSPARATRTRRSEAPRAPTPSAADTHMGCIRSGPPAPRAGLPQACLTRRAARGRLTSQSIIRRRTSESARPRHLPPRPACRTPPPRRVRAHDARRAAERAAPPGTERCWRSTSRGRRRSSCSRSSRRCRCRPMKTICCMEGARRPLRRACPGPPARV
jgi:hypothetical protein